MAEDTHRESSSGRPRSRREAKEAARAARLAEARVPEQSSSLVQITSRSGVVRGPADSYQTPELIELRLEAHQRVVQVDWQRGHESRTRKTVDWTWTVWIESRP